MTATTQRILYTAKRRTTGLTDCKVTVYDESGSVVVNAQVMTELANGDYYYDYTPTSAGTHVWYADSDSEFSPLSGTFVSDYTTAVSTTTSTAEIANTLDLARFINIEGVVPSINSTGSARTKEVVGTGDNSNTLFYLDQARVLSSSYTFYYGATETGATVLTEDTHYTLNKNNGTLTLTSAGVTLIGTDNIYAQYSYSLLEITDTQLQTALNHAEQEVKSRTYGVWTDGTQSTPSYAQESNEKHIGKGRFDRSYFLLNFPLPLVTTNLNGAVTASDTTITVDSTNGFLSSGTINIGADKITYTGKTSTTFTGCTGVNNNHDDASEVLPFVFEYSSTVSGTTPSWQILQKDSDYDLDYDSGKVHIYRDDIILDYYTTGSPPRSIPNRFRGTYIWGYSEVPEDIKRLVLMLGAKQMIHMTVRRTLTNGMGDFRPDNTMIDENWIDKTIEHYRLQKTVNT